MSAINQSSDRVWEPDPTIAAQGYTGHTAPSPSIQGHLSQPSQTVSEVASQVHSQVRISGKEKFLFFNPLSQFWSLKNLKEKPMRLLASPLVHVLGEVGYALALPFRVMVVVKETLHLLLAFFWKLACCDFRHMKETMKIRFICLGGAMGELGSGLVGVILPEVAYLIDEKIQDYGGIVNQQAGFRGKWVDYSLYFDQNVPPVVVQPFEARLNFNADPFPQADSQTNPILQAPALNEPAFRSQQGGSTQGLDQNVPPVVVQPFEARLNFNADPFPQADSQTNPILQAPAPNEIDQFFFGELDWTVIYPVNAGNYRMMRRKGELLENLRFYLQSGILNIEEYFKDQAKSAVISVFQTIPSLGLLYVFQENVKTSSEASFLAPLETYLQEYIADNPQRLQFIYDNHAKFKNHWDRLIQKGYCVDELINLILYKSLTDLVTGNMEGLDDDDYSSEEKKNELAAKLQVPLASDPDFLNVYDAFKRLNESIQFADNHFGTVLMYVAGIANPHESANPDFDY